MPEKPKSRSGAGRKRRLPKDELEDLVEEATIDAYGEEEQVTSFYTVLDEHLTLPFDKIILGVDVTVEKLDLTDRSDDIVIVCRRGRALPRRGCRTWSVGLKTRFRKRCYSSRRPKAKAA